MKKYKSIVILFIFAVAFSFVSCDMKFSLKVPTSIFNGNYSSTYSSLILNKDRSFRFVNSSSNNTLLNFSEGEYKISISSRDEKLNSDGSVVITYKGTITFTSGVDAESKAITFSHSVSSADGSCILKLNDEEFKKIEGKA